MEYGWLPLVLAAAGLLAGLTMLWRGFAARATGDRVADTATSRIATLAAGEVRVSGVVEPAGVTLVSPLQSATCVWYRSRVSRVDGDASESVWSDERGVGFRISDGSGAIRVFPRDARVDAEDRFDDTTGTFGEEPPGLLKPPGVVVDGAGSGRCRYREARLEPGDVVTIVGSAVPFGDLADPAMADGLAPGVVGVDDPEVAADIARARAAGVLVAPDEAWGNAAIAGFGIGRPVSEPDLDPDAIRPPLATPDEAAAAERAWDIRSDELVLSSAPDGRLIIAAGTPGQVEERQLGRFLVGLAGAVLAIGSAFAGAWMVAGPTGR